MTPEDKPLISRILPWIVLLLAALALLYFLDRGCAGGKKVASQETPVSETSPMKPTSGETAQSSSEGITALRSALNDGPVNPNTSFVLGSNAFEGASAVLTRDTQRDLQQLASLLKEHESIKLRIEAHTDNTGGADMNMQLSTQQALAVMTWLQENGVARERLNAVGRGQSKPLVPNDTEENKAKNRRIELYVIE